MRTDDPAERARRQERLQQAESDFDPLPFDAAAARAFGRVLDPAPLTALVSELATTGLAFENAKRELELAQLKVTWSHADHWEAHDRVLARISR